MNPSCGRSLALNVISAVLVLTSLSCGGGGGEGKPSPPPSAPVISSFTSAKNPITLGTSTALTAVYINGTGVITNGVGAVSSGNPITISPTTDTTYNLTVTNNASVSVSQSVTVAVVAPPARPEITAPLTVATGAINLTASVADQSGCTYAWSINGGSITAGTGTRSITFSAGSPGTLTLSCVTTNAAGTASSPGNFTISVVSAPPVISYTQANFTFMRSMSIDPLVPVNTGGPAESWSIVPALPNGLLLNAATGVITGSPQTISASATYTVTALNPGGSGTATLTITINDSVIGISYSPSSLVLTQGVTILPLMPTVIGGTPISWAILPALPTGLAFNSSTGIITGSPEILSSTSDYTVTATHSGGISTATLGITVVAAPSIATFTASPTNILVGGTSVLTCAYSNGLGLINQGIGAISSNETKVVSPASTTTYSLTITNAAGATLTSSVTVTVVLPPSISSFTASSTQFYVNRGTAVTAVFSNGIGVVNPGGFAITSGIALAVKPGMVTRYVLTVTNPVGTKASTSLTVYPGNGVAAAMEQSLTLSSDGAVHAWGSNNFGQLGDGTWTDHSSPVLLSGMTGVVALAGGGYHSIALKAGGTIWAWGSNTYGELGDGTTNDSITPVQVSGLTGIVAIAGSRESASHSLALKSDGVVWAWGNNETGQLGDGTTTNRSLPVRVKSLTGVVALDCGPWHSLALKSDGTVWAWGSNMLGQLGDGTATDRYTPVQVSGLTNVVALAGGFNHCLALKADGTVWTWGSNSAGQLGDGTTTNRPLPTRVINLTGIVALAGAGYHSLALKADGTVWSWGSNMDGELGDGGPIGWYHSAPVQVIGMTGVVSLVGGLSHSLALKADGTVWSWGVNNYGQLGDGTTTNRPTAVKVPSLNLW